MWEVLLIVRLTLSMFVVLQESPRGCNLVTLTDTTAQAVMQDDGSVYCQPEVLFEGLI